ncbi:MAG: DUF3800 domain-containing protein [Bacteroidales bacterium]|nr:DUF3800 domain-containing protein [Bacteroidales bacterium]
MPNTTAISVFVDESGSDILNNKDIHDRYYVSVGVVVPSDSVSALEEQLESISLKFNNGSEFKSSKIGSDLKRRIKLLEMLKDVQFQYFAFAVDKKLIDKESGYRYRNSYYKNVNKHLYERIARSSAGRVDVIIDAHGTKEFQESAELYFKNKCDWYRTIDFKYVDDKSSRLIQIADIIAGSIRIILLKGFTEQTSKMRTILREKEILFQKWPFDYTTHLVGRVNTQDVDKKIEAVMFERIALFMRLRCDSKDEYDGARVKALQRLVEAYYLDEGSIYSEELRALVNANREKPLSEEAFLSVIIGEIRKEGIVVAGTKKGYKLATTVSDVAEYLNHTRLVIMPMLSKLRAARCLLKTSAEYDILMSPEYDDLKVILDAIDDSHFGIADNESSGASMGESK